MNSRGGVPHGTGNRAGRSSASCTSSYAKLLSDAVGLGPLQRTICWERRSRTHQRFVRALRYVVETWPRLSGLVRTIYATKNPPRGWHAKKASVRGCAKINRNRWERDIWVRKNDRRQSDQYVRTIVHELYHLFQARNMLGYQFTVRYHRSELSKFLYEKEARRMGELAAKRFRSA